MKSMTVRDLRHKWPEAESLLKVEEEIVITRDAKPVAKLVRYKEPEKARKRFDPVAHRKWQQKLSGGKMMHLVDKYLAAGREDRPLISKHK